MKLSEDLTSGVCHTQKGWGEGEVASVLPLHCVVQDPCRPSRAWALPFLSSTHIKHRIIS